MFKRIFEKQKKLLLPIIERTQKIIVTIFLFLLYLFGFGLTAIVMLFFSRKLLGFTKKNKNTFWEDAKNYDSDINRSLKQF